MPFGIWSIRVRIFQFLDIRAKLRASAWARFFKPEMTDDIYFVVFRKDYLLEAGSALDDPRAWLPLKVDAAVSRAAILNDQRRDALILKAEDGSGRRSHPRTRYPAAMLAAKKIDVEVPRDAQIRLQFLKLTHWMEIFKNAEEIIVRNLHNDDVEVRMAQGRGFRSYWLFQSFACFTLTQDVTTPTSTLEALKDQAQAAAI